MITHSMSYQVTGHQTQGSQVLVDFCPLLFRQVIILVEEVHQFLQRHRLGAHHFLKHLRLDGRNLVALAASNKKEQHRQPEDESSDEKRRPQRVLVQQIFHREPGTGVLIHLPVHVALFQPQDRRIQDALQDVRLVREAVSVSADAPAPKSLTLEVVA